MQAYTVHQPPDETGDAAAVADALVFVKDGFTFTAALVPPLWMAAKGLWLPLLGYAVGVVVVPLTLLALGAPSVIVVALVLAAHLWIGFEAASLERLSLEGRGWSTIATITGRSYEECERRFFEIWLAAGGVSDERSRGDRVTRLPPQTRPLWDQPMLSWWPSRR
jgi:hypothetical protein